MIRYQFEPELSAGEFIAVLNASTLGERRPVHDLPRIEAMLKHADLILTAREGGLLVGVARSVTDYVYCHYLSDLAVAVSHQKHGIGRTLIKMMKTATPQAKLILLSAPNAVDYYPHIGMKGHAHAYHVDELKELK